MLPRRTSVLTVLASLVATTLLPLTTASAQEADGPAFISEFHYDNASTDVGEFVEVTAPAGTDLTGWSIVLYNGNGASSYDTDALAGTVADEADGYGTAVVEYPSNGIQNGSPDGIALVDAAGSLVEFLSYEGTLTAADGPAAGVESRDVGVSQAGTETEGSSIERIGEVPTAWEWVADGTSSKGELNDGLTVGSGGGTDPDPEPDPDPDPDPEPIEGTVFVSEFHYDNTGTDADEFVEVTAPAGSDLTGWSIVLYNGNGGSDYATRTLSGAVVDQVAGYGTLTVDVVLQNGAPDGIALVDPDGQLVEFLSYEGTVTAADGPAAGVESRDVVVEQGSDTPAGASIERVGEVPDGFVWIADDDRSAGAPNPGSTIDGTLIPVPDPAPVAECADLTTNAGSAASATQRASDETGTVSDVTLDRAPAGVTLADVAPAAAVGGTLTAELVVDETAPVGEHDLTLTFRNDDPEPQAVDCLVSVRIVADVCQDPAEALTPISEVQGSGDASPIEGDVVVVEGVVVGDFQNNDQPDHGDLNGFYVQSLDPDDDPTTSEGLFVFSGGLADVETGDVVRVEGTVDEYFEQTQLSSVSRLSTCGDAALPEPVEVVLPLESPDDYERYEGMYVTFPQDLAISEYYSYAQYGELTLALPFDGLDRQHTPTAVVEPGAEATELLEASELRRITLDDGRTVQNPDLNRHPNGDAFTLDNRFRGGDTVTHATGVLSYSFDLWRIQPTEGAEHTGTNPRPAEPDDVGGDLTVASFNVLNYFLTIDPGPDVCGPAQDADCRGADDQEEFDRQRAKILAALTEIEADVFGLVEMENTPGVDPLADLVDGLNAELGAGTYDHIDTGVVGTDAIRNGFIYDATTVVPVGEHVILDSSVDPRFDDQRSRPVIAQTFEEIATGERFTVAVNHLKSKGSACDDDPDEGDGQGNCSDVRTAAAEAMVDWLASDPTGSGDEDVLIIGDLNAYDHEDPIDAVREGPDDELGTGDDYVDLVRAFVGEHAYSYVFDGFFGYLDHALANASMSEQVTGTTVWNINADEPGVLDYDTQYKSPGQVALYEPNAFRSSDHDPVIVGLQLGEPTPPPPSGPVTKDDCKRGGWRSFEDPSFRNQGQCVAHVASNGRSGGGNRPA